MRAILIDPFNKTVTEVETPAELHDIYKLIQCTIIDAVNVDERHCIYVDDNGLTYDEPLPVFRWQSYHQPLAGRALLLGFDQRGENVSATMPLGVAMAQVSFPAISIDEITTHEYTREDGTYVIENRPHFKRTGKE